LFSDLPVPIWLFHIRDLNHIFFVMFKIDQKNANQLETLKFDWNFFQLHFDSRHPFIFFWNSLNHCQSMSKNLGFTLLQWWIFLSLEQMCFKRTIFFSKSSQLFRFHTRCKLFHSRTKKYQFLRTFLCFYTPIVGARWSNCMKCTHPF
jgi:hypothetical protein